MDLLDRTLPPHEDLRRCRAIHLDMAGNCNLRCPYCINDFTQVHGNVLMSETVFDRVLRLLPLIRSNGYLLLSCYFEPTLHPDFLNLVARIPAEYRAIASFTTNLGRRLPDYFFEQLAGLGLHHVNVSLDSLIQDVFEEMRKGARWPTFSSNLDRLVSVFNAHGAGTELHFITMVSRRNLAELPGLVRTCAERYRPGRHEIRTIWVNEEIEARPWVRDQRIDLKGLMELQKSLADFGPSVQLVHDLPVNAHAYTPFPGRSGRGERSVMQSVSGEGRKQSLFKVPPPPILQITSSGRVTFLIGDPDLVVNLDALPDPFGVVQNMVLMQNSNFERAQLLKETAERADELAVLGLVNQWIAEGALRFVSTGAPAGCIDDFRMVTLPERTGTYAVSGWARNTEGLGPADRVVIVLSKGRRSWAVSAPVPDRARLDVVGAFSDEQLLYTGWLGELWLDLIAGERPGRFHLAAFGLDRDRRTAYKLAGERDVEL